MAKGKTIGKTGKEFYDHNDPYASLPFVIKLKRVLNWLDPEEEVNKTETCDTDETENEDRKRRRLSEKTAADVAAPAGTEGAAASNAPATPSRQQQEKEKDAEMLGSPTVQIGGRPVKTALIFE